MNNLQQLGWCLKSLFSYTEFPYQIVVVDNGCKGEVRRYIEGCGFPFIEVFEPPDNLGWMKAINTVLKSCETPLFCMLNDDVIFLPGNATFWRALTTWLGDSNVGAVGPCSNFVAGPQSLMEMSSGLVFESSVLIGVCMVLRTKLFQEIGGLDESLPGGDDLDLSIRLTKLDKVLVVDKSSYINHLGQQTGRRLHGEHYDSRWHQELTNNALIRKHGVAAWYECYQCGTRPIQWLEKSQARDNEENWYGERLKAFNGRRGLNVGCGSRRLGEAINVDLRKNGSKGGAGGMKLQAVDSDVSAEATKLPIESGSQFYVAAAHILEHLLDPIGALTEWRRVLAPGGLLLMTLPDHEIIPTMLIDYTHLHAYSKNSLRRLMELSGFEVESVESFSTGSLRVVAKKPLV